MAARAPTLCPACGKSTRTVSGLCPSCGTGKPREPGLPGHSPSAPRLRQSFFDVFGEAGPVVEVVSCAILAGLVVTTWLLLGAIVAGVVLVAFVALVALVALLILAPTLGGQL
jgi:hypothetical protein